MGLIWGDDKLQAHRDDERAEAARSASGAHELSDAIEHWHGVVDGDDLHNELAEVEDLLNTLAAAGDAEKIGRVVIACRTALVERLAGRSFGIKPVYATEAAALALAGVLS